MENHLRLRWRTAHAVRRQLTILARRKLDCVADHAQQTIHTFDQLVACTRRLRKARQHRWHAAARHVIARMRIVTEDLRNEVNALPRAIEQFDPVLRSSATYGRDLNPLAVAPLGEIVGELDQIEDEFSAWTFDERTGVLSVRTEPVELEDIDLGPFEIRLEVHRLAELRSRSVYDIVALDPHPATGNDHVTHPHVSDKRLCEGDAMEPIRRALESGRLCDFFQLVQSVLQTYNPASPYVALDRWYGVPCAECDDTIDEDECTRCHRCDAATCSECRRCCTVCDNFFCSDCSESCPACDEQVCGACVSVCRLCGERCCQSCLDNDICPSCLESENNHDDEAPEGSPDEPPDESPDESPDDDKDAEQLAPAPAPGRPPGRSPGRRPGRSAPDIAADRRAADIAAIASAFPDVGDDDAADAEHPGNEAA